MDREPHSPGRSLNTPNKFPAWKGYEKFLFRMAFVFFIFLAIPSEPWYSYVAAIDWTNLHYRDIYLIARYIPKYVDTDFLPWMKGYQTMALVFIVSIIIGGVWSILDRKRKQYTVLYYWLRTLVRYRAAIYMSVWGLIKIFPVQCPFPSEGILNTTLGDLPIQKIYWWSVGGIPLYEVFAGLVEFSAGILLFIRRTVPLGAALMAGTLGVLTSANIVYGGGVHIESTYFVLVGFFLLLLYAKDVYRLLIMQRYTVPVRYYPTFNHRWIRYALGGVKVLLVTVFVVLMGYLSYLNFRFDPYNQAITPSPKELRGLYEVEEFRINNQLLPYDPYDSVRWADVSFEKWTSMTFRIYQPVLLENTHGIGFGFNSGAPMRDIDRNLESFTGDVRRVFHYYLDTLDKVLYLEDKSVNVARKNVPITDSIRQHSRLYSSNWIGQKEWGNINDEYTRVDKRAHFTRRYRGYEKSYPVDSKRNRMMLRYEIVGEKRVRLSGLNETGDSLNVLLKRVQKNYVFPKAWLVAGSYD